MLDFYLNTPDGVEPHPYRLSANELDSYDKEMLEVIVFFTDAGMEVASCRMPYPKPGQNTSHIRPGHVAFAFDVYTKNIFSLLEIPLDEELIDDEYFLVYYFRDENIMSEHVQRIKALFRTNA